MMGLDSFGVFDKAAKRGISNSSEARNNYNNINKLQSHKSLKKKKMMTMVHHHDNHHRPFPDPPYQLCYGDGPTLCTNTNYTSSRPKSSNIYDVVFATSDDHPASSASASAVAFGISSPEISHITAFKFPGGMAASLEYPFTIAQWKELERQALIYKYMMASIPVPPDLLFPSIKNPSVPAASHYHFGNGLNLRIMGRGDLEPGRCRRTDGKKWRCSRDVAPDQKYCERHMHRGRPRSRKPVELPKKKTPRHTQNQALPSSTSTVIAPNSSINPSQSPFLGNISHPFHQNQDFPSELRQKSAGFGPNPPFTSSFKEPRGLEWMMNEESVSMAPLDHQHWDNLNQTYDQEPLSLNSYIDFGKNQEINNCGLFLSHDMVPLEKPVQDPERGFINLWSSDGQTANPGIKTDEKLSLSSLSLSVGDHIHMGLGVTDSDQNQDCGTRPNGSSWLPGGPLAEVLRPRTAAPAGKLGSNPPTSPSGVLHRTIASMSDSSGSSSPTFASSGARPEIGLVWLTQGRTTSST